MKCQKCGFEFEEGIFCPECGTKSEEIIKVEVLKEQDAKTDKVNVEPEAKKKKISWYLSFPFIILIALITMALYSIPSIVLVAIRWKKYGADKKLKVTLVVLIVWALFYVMLMSGDSETENSNEGVQNDTVEEIGNNEMTSDADGIEKTSDVLEKENDPVLEKYEKYLNSYDVRIEIVSGEDTSLNKNRYETEVYIDGKQVFPKVNATYIIDTFLEEGTHEIYLVKTTNEKERESNKIKFEVSPEYCNILVLEATLKDKKEYELITTMENNIIFEGYENEWYDGQYIIRTSSGKQIYYTVEFYRAIDDSIKFIDSVSVAHGDAAIAPSAPEIENYKFVGWSADFSYVKSDMKVYANYELYEEEMDIPEYIGKYQLITRGIKSEEYISVLEIIRTTSLGVYFNLNFVDDNYGEVIANEQLAVWNVKGESADWDYNGESEGLSEYDLSFVFFEYDGHGAIMTIDHNHNTNTDSRYDKIE